MRKIMAVVAALALMLTSGCAAERASNVYREGATAGKALKGTLISARPVTIKASDKVSDNVAGAAAGGLAGGAALGSNIGKGSGSDAAAIGGVMLGAVAGAFIQDALSTSEGMEYLVKIDGDHARKSSSKTRKEVKVSAKGSVQEDVKNSIDSAMDTDIVSVVQEADPALAAGAKVYVVYHDDRPRVIPAE